MFGLFEKRSKLMKYIRIIGCLLVMWASGTLVLYITDWLNAAAKAGTHAETMFYGVGWLTFVAVFVIYLVTALLEVSDIVEPRKKK